MQIGAANARAAGILGLAAVGIFGKAGPAWAAETPAEARPPLPDAPPPVPVPWERHLEIGPDVGFAALSANRDATGVRTPVFDPTVGFGLHLNIDLMRNLGFTAYFVDARHTMTLPPGSLGLSGKIEADAAVHTFRFGARLSPSVSLSSRMRLWATAGLGWGRLEFPRMTATDPGGAPFRIRERADSVLEFPVGLGAGFELIRRWLSVQLELTYAVDMAQVGTGQDTAQAIDDYGYKRSIGGLPRLNGFFVETIGISLLL